MELQDKRLPVIVILTGYPFKSLNQSSCSVERFPASAECKLKFTHVNSSIGFNRTTYVIEVKTGA